MVPELAGAAAAEVADLRDAVCEAAAALPTAVDRRRGRARRRDGRAATRSAHSPVTASMSGSALAPGADEPGELPLCALITGWVRGRAKPQAHAEVRVYRGDHGIDAALDRGRRLRAEIEEAADPVGVLVVADGCTHPHRFGARRLRPRLDPRPGRSGRGAGRR